MIQIKMRIHLLTIIKAPNNLVDGITVDRNSYFTIFEFLMIGFKSFLASDVGIFPTMILNVGPTIRGRFLVPEKLT
jgi:hypothetical protein